MTAARRRPFGIHYGYIALAMGTVALTTTLGFGRWSYSLILPGMREGLALTYTQMGVLGTANMLGYLAAVPLAGVAASRYGSRLVIGGCMLVAGLALLATGLAPSFQLALVFQTLSGVASAGAIVPSMALAGIWVAPRKRGLATGLVNSGLGISFFVTGPVIPAMIASSAEMGWRYGWYLVGGVVLLGGVFVSAFMRNRPEDLGLQVMGLTSGTGLGDPPGRPYDSKSSGNPPGGQYGWESAGEPPGQYGWKSSGDPPGGQYGSSSPGKPPGGQYGSRSPGEPPGSQYGSKSSGEPQGDQYGSRSPGEPQVDQYGSRSPGETPGDQYGLNAESDPAGGPYTSNPGGEALRHLHWEQIRAEASGQLHESNARAEAAGHAHSSSPRGEASGHPREANTRAEAAGWSHGSDAHGGTAGRPYGEGAPTPRAGALNWGLVYRSGRVWHLSLIYAIFGFAFASLSTFFAAFLRDQGGVAEGVIGNMWALSGVGMIFGCLTWGSISDRVGRAAGMAIVFFFLAGSIIFFTVSHSLPVYYASAVVFWAAEPGVPVIVAAACADYVGARLAPAAVGFATLFMGVGQAVGPALTGSVADMTGSFDSAFYASAGIGILGIIAALFLRQPGTQL